MVAKPPPYMVNTVRRQARNGHHAPISAKRGMARNRANCATKKMRYVVRRPSRSDALDQRSRPPALNRLITATMAAACLGVRPKRSCIMGDAWARMPIPAVTFTQSMPHSSRNWGVRTASLRVSPVTAGVVPPGSDSGAGRSSCAPADMSTKYTPLSTNSARATPICSIRNAFA